MAIFFFSFAEIDETKFEKLYPQLAELNAIAKVEEIFSFVFLSEPANFEKNPISF